MLLNFGRNQKKICSLFQHDIYRSSKHVVFSRQFQLVTYRSAWILSKRSDSVSGTIFYQNRRKAFCSVGDAGHPRISLTKAISDPNFEPEPDSQIHSGFLSSIAEGCSTSPEGDALYVFNSLTGKKEPFFSSLPNKIISWYSCGPTVYDHSHIGHARNYVCLDIIQRILSDCFGYNVIHVMGMTDVDDKIIRRAEEFNQSPAHLARHFEDEFFQDMKRLNVRLPTVCCRVTEHISHIISYIERILQNGYAYTADDGSVYFSVENFSKEEYCRFRSVQACLNFADQGEFDKSKRSRLDFALWKGPGTDMNKYQSKSQQVFWKSPWCPEGRPGWHIECSAMSHHYLGSHFDVHWGGIDLMFPHHNNEIAQARAHHGHCLKGHSEWVRYFLHSGHLHIQGRKMSKSEKNFITIREFLKECGTVDEFRMFCLNTGYRNHTEYSENHIFEARQQISKFKEFFTCVLEVQEAPHSRPKIWQEAEQNLFNSLERSKARIKAHLRDNFDTGKVIKILLGLVSEVDSYIKRGDCCTLIIGCAFRYVLETLGMFGLQLSINSQIRRSDNTFEGEVLKAMLEFRSKIRCFALEKRNGRDWQDKSCMDELLRTCDHVRDEVLPGLGVSVTDRPDGEYEYKFLESHRTQKVKSGEKSQKEH